MEGHIRVASSIQEHKTGPFNTTADVTKMICFDAIMGLRHLYIITMKVTAAIETK
jgi:hypothetical protein